MANTLKQGNPSTLNTGGSVSTAVQSARSHVTAERARLWRGAEHLEPMVDDRYPGIVIRCAGAADVIEAVHFADDHNLEISTRGGGHNIGGNAVGEPHDRFFAYERIRVDPKAEWAWVEPGATLGDVDKETQHYGLAHRYQFDDRHRRD